MSKYVILNPTHGGTDSGKTNGNVKESDYTLKIANEISRLLNNSGIANKLLRTDNQTISREARIHDIVMNSPDSKDTIVLSIGMDSGDAGIEIVYALRNTDKLAAMMANNLENTGYAVSKYYARRLPGNTSQDYYDILRETGKRESLIIDYGNLSDASFLENNWKQLAEITAKTIQNYLGEVGNFYTVQKGDSLYSIATKYGITVSDLQKVNNLGTNFLSVGQKLLIPEITEEPEEPSGDNLYTVKSGDTLYSIAGKYGITVDSLKQSNNLTSNNLKVGQKLIIPENNSNSNSINYTVKSGDTLYGIASKYVVSVEELKRVNNLTNNLLQIGQKLLIPNGISDIPSTSNQKTYTVQKGDNLYSIANSYGVTVDSIKNLNGLKNNLLQINQVLKIPSENSSSNNQVYIVKRGDNLYNIAQKYNVSVASLMSANNLSSTLLNIGQKLIIP